MLTTDDEGDAVMGYASPDVCRLMNLPPSTLNKWASDGLVTPTLLDTTGRRSTRYWTPEDFVLVRLVKALRDAGCSYELISRARPLLSEAWSSPGADDHFHWDGKDLIEVTAWGDLRSRLQQPGQFLIHYVTTPLQTWLREAEDNACWYLRSDYERLKARRAAIIKSSLNK